jgi:hypothetical protein
LIRCRASAIERNHAALRHSCRMRLLNASMYYARLATDQWPDFAPPFSARGAAVRLDVGGIDHLRLGRSAAIREFAEQVFPNPTLRPTKRL